MWWPHLCLPQNACTCALVSTTRVQSTLIGKYVPPTTSKVKINNILSYQSWLLKHNPKNVESTVAQFFSGLLRPHDLRHYRQRFRAERQEAPPTWLESQENEFSRSHDSCAGVWSFKGVYLAMSCSLSRNIHWIRTSNENIFTAAAAVIKRTT